MLKNNFNIIQVPNVPITEKVVFLLQNPRVYVIVSVLIYGPSNKPLCVSSL
jgi:hypothetical protein